MRKHLLSYRDNMRVEVEHGVPVTEHGVPVTAQIVADLRALPLGRTLGLVRAERASYD